MKTLRRKKTVTSDEGEMQSHYDFRNGEKPNYAKKFRDGAIVTIEVTNGRPSRQKRIETKPMVVLDSDISKVFANGKSVNPALRHLIAALPKQSRSSR